MLLGAALLTGSAVAWVLRERRSPSACPFSPQFFLDLPRPFTRRATLHDVLAPVSGEHVLEVGSGTGYYSLPVAREVVPGGRLVVLDLEPAMLDELMRRAEAERIANIDPVQGDAQALPFADEGVRRRIPCGHPGGDPRSGAGAARPAPRAETGWPVGDWRRSARSAHGAARLAPWACEPQACGLPRSAADDLAIWRDVRR